MDKDEGLHERCKIWKGGLQEETAARREDHSMLMMMMMIYSFY